MPFGILNHVLTNYEGNPWDLVKDIFWKYAIWILPVYALRRWCAGGTNQTLRRMASRVVIVTVPPTVLRI